MRFGTPEEEGFIHLLGMEYRLGRRTCSVKGAAVVRVWKAWLYINATIPCAEALIGGGFGATDVDTETSTEALKGLKIMPSFRDTQSTSSGEDEQLRVHFIATYRLSAEGQFTMQVQVDAGSMVAPLPRVGLQLNLPLSLQHLRWCGTGPHECYADRRASGVCAVHGADLLEETMHVPYLRPGENGSRAGVKWAQFHSNEHLFRSELTTSDRSYVDSESFAPQQRTLKIQSSSDFHFSAQRYSTEDLASAMHINDVAQQPRPYFAVNLDPFLMGVGGDDSWSSCVHTEDLLQHHLGALNSTGRSQTYNYELSFFLS